MLWEAITAKADDDDADDDRLKCRELLLLALATSIDALAVGITFAFIPVSILPAVGLIGAVTAVFAFAGIVVGRRVGARLGRPAEIIGGLVLIGIGTRILFDHLGVW
jgi:putative Mn2+ efflux pump MntP